MGTIRTSDAYDPEVGVELALAGYAPLTAEGSSDEDVIALTRDGASDAFEVLVRRYGDMVFRTIFLMSRDRELAEDVTQEAFVHAWRGLRGFRKGSAFRPWLLRIAVNRLISHKRRKLLSIVPLSWTEREAASLSPSPEAIAENAALSSALRDAISALPQDQRIALVLRYYADLSVPEIARVTRWREGTVKSRLHRAIGRLRVLMEPAMAEGDARA